MSCDPSPSPSQMVYPVPGREEVTPHDARLMSGKYEPLVHMNVILGEEIQKAMASELSKLVHIDCTSCPNLWTVCASQALLPTKCPAHPSFLVL